MSNYSLKIFILLSIFLSGCAPTWKMVSQEPLQTKGYTVDLPENWLYLQQPNGAILSSIDGPLLQSISITKEPYKKAFKTSKQEVPLDALTHELMDYYVAEIKSKAGELTIEVDNKEATLISGQDGFKITIHFKNAKGLRLQSIYTGFGLEGNLYIISYTAPVLHYFDKNLSDYNKVLQSFRLKSN